MTAPLLRPDQVSAEARRAYLDGALAARPGEDMAAAGLAAAFPALLADYLGMPVVADAPDALRALADAIRANCVREAVAAVPPARLDGLLVELDNSMTYDEVRAVLLDALLPGGAS